jgi:hypothetical protein
MPSYSLSDFFNKLRSPPRRTLKLHDHSAAVGILAASRPILAFSPSQPPSAPSSQESTGISTLYRNTSDAAQAFLPPVQAVADVIPGVGSIIKGAIGGTLSVLQLVDRYVQNKDDLEKLTLRLHLLCHHIDNAPIARTVVEDTLRLRLLRHVTRGGGHGLGSNASHSASSKRRHPN